MSAEISYEQVRSILEASRPPSGDNSQPWTFEWDGRVLSILFDPERARHVLDAGLCASRIALGCLIESLEIAASASGFALRFQENGLTSPQRAAAEVEFVWSGRERDPLGDALATRSTDRRFFQGGALPKADLNTVADSFGHKNLIHLGMQEATGGELHDFVVAAESLVTAHPTIFPETVRWIRMTGREVQRTRDGMPWRGTGVEAVEYPALWTMRRIPSTFPVVSRMAMRRVHRAKLKRLIESSAGLYCFSISGDGNGGLFEMGRLAMRLWLRLTQLGYGVQPLTLSSLLVFNHRSGVLDGESARLFGEEYKSGEGILRRAFAIPDSHFPAWMFRTGRSTPLPASWVTPRREVSSILRVKQQ